MATVSSSKSMLGRSHHGGQPASEVFPTFVAARILAISDLHVDYKENMDMVKAWTSERHRRDALIVAGDVTDDLRLLETTLRLLKSRFAHVFFVPGNHELWIRPKERCKDSVAKFKAILKLCDKLGVHTRPARILLPVPGGRSRTRSRRNVSTSSFHEASLSDPESDSEDGGPILRRAARMNRGAHIDSSEEDDELQELRPSHHRVHHFPRMQTVWIVPLHSWYSTPDDDTIDSLYVRAPASWKEDPKACEKMWMDNILCKWPARLPNGHRTRSQYFASQNEEILGYKYEGPVITFSHVLPRQDLLKPSPEDEAMVNQERRKRGLGDMPPFKGPCPGGFNFTRFAGARVVERQLRRVGSVVHVFGHQHRNRDRVIEGVRYVQHCMGSCKEQEDGYTYGLDDWNGPKQVWPKI